MSESSFSYVNCVHPDRRNYMAAGVVLSDKDAEVIPYSRVNESL